MARLPRLHVPGAIQYLLQRATADRVLIADADDATRLRRLLEAACRTHGFALHAYALTPSEIHLLGTPAGPLVAAEVLQTIGRAYVPAINRKTGRSGALWDRRYRSTVIDPDLLLPVMCAVEAHATQQAAGPRGTAHSSLAHHVGDCQEALITDHARYWALSDTPFERQSLYRRSYGSGPDAAFAARVDDAVERGWALGSPPFVQSLAETANRRAAPLPRGRPRKRIAEVSPKY